MTDVAFVDDDDALRAANVQSLLLAGLDVAPFASAAAVLEAIDADFPGVVVTDVRMPRIDGLELFRRLRLIDPEIPVILITGHGDIAMAVDAMREGAYDFLAKPYASERLLGSVRHALDRRRLVLENRALRRAAEAAADDGMLIGTDRSIELLRNTLRQIADTDVDVLIEGETGSGKDVAANALHSWSNRADRPFVAVNCGALPETMIESELFGHEPGAFTGALKKRIGRIEHAQGGTLFLDEIEAMSPALQVKLLRVLETRQITPLGTNDVRRVSIRIVAATKVDLLALTKQGSFREDLYYRLHVVKIRIPPLRERRADIPLLFGHFLARAARRFGRAQPAIGQRERHFLLEHSWPGNIRELAHYAERVALGLDGEATAGSDFLPLPKRVEAYEGSLIREALAASRGDIQGTLETLGIPRKTFYDKLHRHGIDQSKYREAKS
jgi:two-component system C4-dicarboxylate transport response regulator DctD